MRSVSMATRTPSPNWGTQPLCDCRAGALGFLIVAKGLSPGMRDSIGEQRRAIPAGSAASEKYGLLALAFPGFILAFFHATPRRMQ